MDLSQLTIGFAMTGSFCTFAAALDTLRELTETGAKIIPILSPAAFATDTRFGKAEDFRLRIRELCGNDIITTIDRAEPIGPKKLLDAMLILPCTGNTLTKISLGVTDTSVTMAAKAHLRNERPLVIAVSTNDALSGSAKNIGALLNTRNVYFVPMRQDDCHKKPRSVVADFSKALPALSAALEHTQLQPIFCAPL